MIERIRSLQEKLNDLQSALRRIRAKQVSQTSILESSRNIVDSYFRDIREQVINAGIDTMFISGLDSSMHQLLEATHHKTTLGVYKKNVSRLKALLLECEKLSLLAAGENSRQFQLDPIDRRIIDTLKKILPSAALSYEQALIDVNATQRLSWRGPATDFREALRECLDYLAPDREIESSPGFKLESNARGPTMKQKTQYVLRKRELSKTAINTARNSVAVIEEMLGSFVRSVYSRASASTHTPTDKKEVTRIRELVRVVLCELLSLS